jgi:hypothetical protein
LRPDASSQEIADAILTRAIERDQGRPGDDMAVVTMSIIEQETPMIIRRMQAQFPMP